MKGVSRRLLDLVLMKKKKLKKYGMLIMIYGLLALAFYFIGDEQIKSVSIEDKIGNNTNYFSELATGMRLEQYFTSKMDDITGLEFTPITFSRENEGHIVLTVKDVQSSSILISENIDVKQFQDNVPFRLEFANKIKQIKGRELSITVESYCEYGRGITLFYSSQNENNNVLLLNGENVEGCLSLIILGADNSLFGSYYWLWTGLAGIIILIYAIWSDYQGTRGRFTKGNLVFVIWNKYRFLMQQLVARDFKTKYKRSVLGYLWSFLNPLLTMLVQYVVFSTIFKANIDNYPVYLLTGIILFNFFSEAVGQGLSSIVSNAQLITKVYVPKYIYPVTKVASTSINLFISIIPLLLVVLLTGVKVTKSIFLLPFVLGCLLLFCVGMVLLLSSAMVFFRDTQYLWGIFSMIWMYATPLFYPENIIPDHFKFIQTFNPMYHMIKFARILFIEGVSPSPMTYFACLVSAIVPCVVGAIVFKKTQNKFVLYI